MKQLLLIVAYLVCAESLLARSTIPWPDGFEQRIHVDDSGEHKYFVYVPEGEPPTGGWPVILFLHGAGERGSDGVSQIAVGLGTALEQRERPFVAVFPQCQERGQRYRAGWLSETRDARRAMEILADVENTVSINSDKRILCGWSMGGYGAWSIAAAQPQRWSAVLAISGGMIEPDKLVSLAKSQVPVWAIHGAADEIVPAAQTQEACQTLRMQSGLVAETIVEGQGHDVWRYVFAQDSTYAWLMDPVFNQVPEISTEVNPLPARSDFYSEHFSHKVAVPHALGMRLGNQALQELASAVPGMLNDQLRGELPDIKRTLGEGANSVEIQLRQISWSCQLSQCELKAISGGRFLASFDFAPIELKIGTGLWENHDNRAVCKNARIVIGHRRPVTLSLELRPKMDENRLTLIPLRKSFSISDDNWFVEPPQHIQVQRGNLNPEHLRIGVVGGLYLQKASVTEQILEAVPELLTHAEDFLQSRPAPALTRVIWPFPVGGPEIVVSPERVGTDRSGISLILNASVIRYGDDSTELPHVDANCRIHLEDLQRELDGEVLACLDLTNACSQVQQDRAWVNVLDIPSSQPNEPGSATSPFSSLVERDFTRQAFGQGESMQAILRVLKPMSVQAINEDQQIRLCVPEVALDYSTSRHAARLIFSLKHDIQFRLHSSGDVRVMWSDHPEIEFIEARRLVSSAKLEADESLILSRLRDCWTEWTQAQNQSFHAPQLPGTNLKLNDLQIEPHAVRLKFETGKY